MKTVLYLGTDPEEFLHKKGSGNCRLVHYPVIAIAARPIDHPAVKKAYADLARYTHILFTSKNAVRIFFDHVADLKIDKKQVSEKVLIAIGGITAAALSSRLRWPDSVSQRETQEGLIELLERCPLDDAFFLLPQSSLARSVLKNFFKQRKIMHCAYALYDTLMQRLEPVPDLREIDEIVFTSPSTVKGFLQIFGALPKDKILHAIGPITEQALLLRGHQHVKYLDCYLLPIANLL